MECGAFKVLVVGEGDFLELIFDWIKPLIDIRFMPRKLLRASDGSLQDFHPKILGFEASLKGLRENRTKDITSTCCIVFPFTVQSDINEKYNISL